MHNDLRLDIDPANATRVRLIDAATSQTSSIAGVEALKINTGSASDSVAVHDLGSTPVASISLDLGDGDDALDASDATTPLLAVGGAGDDILQGGSAADVLAGGAGSDAYKMSFGQDTIDDDQGQADLLDFSSFPHAVSVDLDASARRMAPVDSAGNALRLMHPIQRLIGSPFSDTLLGSHLSDSIAGGLGDDSIDGDAGNDVLVGGLILNNPQGLFQAAYPHGVADGTDSVAGGAGSDKLHGVAPDTLADDGVDILFGG